MSLPRAIGRDSVTCIAVSRPCRIAVIIPDAAHAKRTKLMSPTALSGVAIDVIASSTFCLPSSETGSQPTIVSTTSLRTASFCRMSPKIETRTIASGASENRTR